MNGPRFLAIALLTGVGSLGLLGGVVLERSLLGAAPPEGSTAVVPQPGSSAEAARNQCESRESSRSWHSRVSKDLELSDQQELALEQLLHEQRERLDATMDGIRPRMKEIVAETHGEFLDLLTPEQRERFEELRSRTNRDDHTSRRGR